MRALTLVRSLGEMNENTNFLDNYIINTIIYLCFSYLQRFGLNDLNSASTD